MPRHCKVVDMPGGGHAILCGNFNGSEPCVVCGKASQRLCDYQVSPDKTCDKPLCLAHTYRPAVFGYGQKDYCPEHAKMIDRELAIRDKL